MVQGVKWHDELVITTADPDFVSLADEELRQAFRPGRPELASTPLAPGVQLIHLPQSVWELAERWHKRPPIFVRHICPAQIMVPRPELDALATAVREAFPELFDPTLTFSVQTRILDEGVIKPYDVNTALAAVVRDEFGIPLDVRRPQQILSVVLARPGRETVAYLGLSPAVFNLSDWAGGVRRFKREPGQISRAEFKLLEALESFGIELPANGRALDLGAAPGGWTRVLRQKGQYVTAVDPGELAPAVALDPRVQYRQMTAEAYLASGPDTFDLIVNDMRLDARDSSRLMVAFAPYLYSHGLALMTLKLPEQGRRPVLDHAFEILRQRYEIVGARQLFHNRSEITVYLRPVS